jgi:hypothetical protein
MFITLLAEIDAGVTGKWVVVLVQKRAALQIWIVQLTKAENEESNTV